MDENVGGVAKHVHEAEAFQLVEPFDAGGHQFAGVLKFGGKLRRTHVAHDFFVRLLRLDFDQFHRLKATVAAHHAHRNLRALGDRGAARSLDATGVQKDVAVAAIWNDKPRAPVGVVPFHPARADV